MDSIKWLVQRTLKKQPLVIDMEDEEARLDQEEEDYVDGPQSAEEVVDIGSVEGRSSLGLDSPTLLEN